MKAKTILAVVFTALCWISLCLDWNLAMYLTGFIALVLTGLDDIKIYFREMTEKFRQFSVKGSVTSASSRQEALS